MDLSNKFRSQYRKVFKDYFLYIFLGVLIFVNIILLPDLLNHKDMKLNDMSFLLPQVNKSNDKAQVPLKVEIEEHSNKDSPAFVDANQNANLNATEVIGNPEVHNVYNTGIQQFANETGVIENNENKENKEIEKNKETAIPLAAEENKNSEEIRTSDSKTNSDTVEAKNDEKIVPAEPVVEKKEDSTVSVNSEEKKDEIIVPKEETEKKEENIITNKPEEKKDEIVIPTENEKANEVTHPVEQTTPSISTPLENTPAEEKKDNKEVPTTSIPTDNKNEEKVDTPQKKTDDKETNVITQTNANDHDKKEDNKFLGETTQTNTNTPKKETIPKEAVVPSRSAAYILFLIIILAALFIMWGIFIHHNSTSLKYMFAGSAYKNSHVRQWISAGYELLED